MSKLENWIKEFVGIVSMWLVIGWVGIYLMIEGGFGNIYSGTMLGLFTTGCGITFAWFCVRWWVTETNTRIQQLQEQLGDQMTDIAIWKQEVKEKTEEIERQNNIINPKPESEIPLSPYGQGP